MFRRRNGTRTDKSSVSEYDLMHGAVLAKICRNDRALTLSLIETSDDKRSAYLINDWLVIIKYSLMAKKNDDGAVSWRFTLTPDTVDLVSRTLAERSVFFALVCPLERSLRNPQIEICLMYPEDIFQSLHLDEREVAQWLVVEYKPRHKLRVWGPANNGEPILIQRKRLDDWKLPGR